MRTADMWEDELEKLNLDDDGVYIKCRQRSTKNKVNIGWASFTVRSIDTKDCAFQMATDFCHISGNIRLEDGRGGLYYDKSYRLFVGDTLVASIFYGGKNQKNTCHFSATENFFYSVMNANKIIYEIAHQNGVDYLSRVDLNVDCFDASLELSSVKEKYELGYFKPCRGVQPAIYGHYDDFRGSTTYIGRRENGKMLRVYEKGMQLARVKGWVRVELELRNVNRRLPIEILLDPAPYFAGANRFCAELADTQITEKIKTFKELSKLSVARLVQVCNLGYGKLIKFLYDSGLEPESIIAILTAGREGLPRRMQVGDRNDLLQHSFV